MLYGNMSVYMRVMTTNDVWFWWKFSRKKIRLTKHCRYFLRLLTASRLHENDKDRNKCCLCHIIISDKTSHMLFDCQKLREKIINSWTNVQNVMPPALMMELNRMNSTEKTIFLANGLNGSYTHEWNDVYESVLIYVKVIYDEIMIQLDDD